MSKQILKYSTLLLLPVLAGFGPVLSIVEIFGLNLFAFRLMVLLGFGMIFIGLIEGRQLDRAGISYLLFFYFWVFWAVLSAAWTYDVTALASGVVILCFGLLTSLLVLLLVRDAKAVLVVRTGWLIGAVIFCGFGIVEIFTDWHFHSEWYDGQPDYIKPFLIMSTFGNPNNFGGFLVLAIAFLFSKKMRSGFYILSLFVLFFSLLFLTGNRIGIIGVVLILFLRFSKSILPAITIIPLLIGIIAYLPEIASFIDHPELQSLISLAESDSSACSSVGIRVNLGEVAVTGLVDSALLGVGSGNFGEIINRNGLESLTCGITDPHNWFFEIAGEYGLIVFTMYLLILIIVLHRGLSVFSVAWAAGLSPIILVTGFVFASVGNSTFSGPPMNWLFFGILLAISLPSRKRLTLRRCSLNNAKVS